MGRFFLGGKALNINGKPVEYNNGTLSFTVSGTSFPFSSIGDSASTYFWVSSSESNTATIDYGDGSIINYEFKGSRLLFSPAFPLGDSNYQAMHNYTDSNSGQRTIRISFSKPDKVTNFIIAYSRLFGSFPVEISNLVNLNTIEIIGSKLTSFPVSISTLTKLESLSLSRVGTAISTRIPDEFVPLNLKSFSCSSSIDLGDVNTSNLLNFLSHPKRSQLKELYIDSCNVITVPDEISNCVNLETLVIGSNNPFETLPSQINTIPSLKELTVGAYTSSNENIKYWGSLSKLINLTTIDCVLAKNIETNLPEGLENCTLLKQYNVGDSYQTTERIDEFIKNFYFFIEKNAEIKGLFTLPFRGMLVSLFRSSLSAAPSGIFQQPTDYEQEVYNGTPASPKEMLWVLINQYGHTITYTP